MWAATARMEPWHWAGLGVLLVGFGFVCFRVHFHRTFIPSDDALYLLLSRSLRHLTYRETWVVGAPWHAHFPPLYPATLAVVGGLFGEHWTAFFVLDGLMAAAALLLTFDAARRLWSPTIALGVLLVAVLNYQYALWTSEFVIAEAQYTLLTTLALWLFLVSGDRRSRMALVWIGLLAVLAGLTRVVGVALVVALALDFLLARRWRALFAFGAVSAATVGLWLTWSMAGEPMVAGVTYRAALVDASHVPGVFRILPVRLMVRAARHGVTYLASVVPRALDVPSLAGTVVDNVFWLLLFAALAGTGLVFLLVRWRPAGLYVIGYAAVLSVWPWALQRLLVPVLPLLILLLVGGGWELLRRIAPKRAPLLLGAVLLLLTGGAGAALARIPRCRSDSSGRVSCQPRNRIEYAEAARFLRRSGSAPGVVVASRYNSLALQSGRTVMPAYRAVAGAPDGLAARLRAWGVPLVLVSTAQSDDRRLAEEVRANCGDFVVDRAFSETSLLLRVRSATADAGDDACATMDRYFAAAPAQPRNAPGREGYRVRDEG